MATPVNRIAPASSEIALQHYTEKLTFETDCWDVHHGVTNGKQDFVLLDVRNEESFAKGHLPNAINLPHWKINEESLGHFDEVGLFVVYCAGTHCNGSTKAAIAIAKRGHPVKEMIGGIVGWLDEGFELVQ